MKNLVYEEGKTFYADVTKKDLTALRKRFDINKDGQCGTTSSGFEISGDKTCIWGKGKIWKTVIKVLAE